ncbi:MAG: restriction endonuclease subunit S [Patescibacteria group bacterium]
MMHMQATNTKFKETEIGLIPEEWGVLRVGDIGRVITGKTPPTKHAEYFGGEYPFVKIPDMAGSMYIRNSESMLSQEGADYLGKTKLPKDSIMVSCIATVGNVGITTRDSFTNQQINSVIPNKDIIDPRYLYYFFTGNKEYLTSLGGGGSVYTNISKSKFENMAVAVPELAEQNVISDILSSLDYKIELNRQMNANLEKMASALFKRWFVDFEFPDENGRPYRSSGGKMAESEMGEIPEGWRVAPFYDAVEIIGGGTPKTTKSDYWEGNIPWFSVVDAPNELDVFVVDTENKITDAGIENSAARIMEEGTTIITARGTVGKIALVGVPMAMNQSCYGLRGKFDRRGFYTYFYTKALITSLQNSAHGSVFDTITRETFMSVDLVMPKVDIITAFEEKVSSTLGSIKNNLFETRTLSQLRDALLPRLMSGKIRTI